MPRLTIFGMYNYDPTLFDGVVLPAGIDKDTLINEIIKRSGDLYPYYQVPPMLKQNISYWFLRRRYDFEQMYRALTTDYNPLENYDRYEDLTRNYKNSGKDDTTRNYQNTGSSTDNAQSGGTSTDTVSAYNSSDYVPRNKTDSNGTSSNQNTTQSSSSDTATMNYGAIRDEVETNHIHGNIGVTTASAMIRESVQLREELDIYALIASLFEKEFMVQLY